MSVCLSHSCKNRTRDDLLLDQQELSLLFLGSMLSAFLRLETSECDTQPLCQKIHVRGTGTAGESILLKVYNLLGNILQRRPMAIPCLIHVFG